MNTKLQQDGSSLDGTAQAISQGTVLERSNEGPGAPTALVAARDSNGASQVLNEGRLLAGLLRHKEYLPAHLLLAISRTDAGIRELEKWSVKASNVSVLCWKALEKEVILLDRELGQDDPSTRATVSADLMEIHRWAGIIAAGSGQATLEFDDLVEAIVASRISPRFVHLYAAEPMDIVANEIRGAVNSIKAHAEAEAPLVQKKLDDLHGMVTMLKTSQDDSFDKQRTNLQRQLRKIRYLGFAMGAIILIVATFFAIRPHLG